MLRLGAGWSAEKLSQECLAREAYLTRTTIAKIESSRRRITAGEVEGVARVFGLTSTDLLDPDGPQLFLSYTEHDEETGRDVTDWLADHGFQVLSTNLPAAGREEPSAVEARAIDIAKAFVVLLSPSFLSSQRCQEELKLAMRRKQHILADGLATDFIYVLRLADTPDLDDSGLETYSQIDLTYASNRSREIALSRLGGSIISSPQASAGRADPLVRIRAGADGGSTRTGQMDGSDNPEDEPPVMDAEDTGLIFRAYVPSDRLYAAELDKFLSLFRGWLGGVRGHSIRQDGYETRAGKGL